jgi:predicted nucleic acid-binding protein
LSLYVDASAVVKLYVHEPESDEAAELLRGQWASGRHTLVEVRRALSQALAGPELSIARDRFASDWERTLIVELDEHVCGAAAELAESTGVRALDALHLAAAELLGRDERSFVTFDQRLAAAARSLGWTVLGA